MLLTKGVEVELFTGTPQGAIVGLSDKIVADLDLFRLEVDKRFVEYSTVPLCSYKQLLCDLVHPRLQLREYLNRLGGYTLIPGSSLSLGGNDRFEVSNPNYPYYEYLKQTYGTSMLTTGIHINIGISDPELLMRACRLIRVEAPLYLALSAASPFLDHYATGYHSTRWHMFPKSPTHVPLFENHAHFIQWTEAQLKAGTMQNTRHLYTSVRPNGDDRPYNLNRLELRICDFMENPIELLSVVAFLEARLWQLIANPQLDPVEMSILPATTRTEDLIALTQLNEAAVAQRSLDAELRHWYDGRKILARDWIQEIYQDAWAIAKQRRFSCFLSPIEKVLREGNTAQRWLKQHNEGIDCQRVLMRAIASMASLEQDLVKTQQRSPENCTASERFTPKLNVEKKFKMLNFHSTNKARLTANN